MRQKHKFRRLRMAGQGMIFLLFVYIIWVTRYPLKGFINPLALFQLDPLVMIATATSERLWLAGLWLSIATLAATLLLGRAFCGWFCPLGAVHDLWERLLRLLRIPRPKETGPGGKLRLIKYAVLAMIAAAAFAGTQIAWSMDPLTIFVRSFSFVFHPLVTRAVDSSFVFLMERGALFLEPLYNFLRMNVLEVTNPVFPHSAAIIWVFAAILALALFRRRFWCRYLCPLGALLALPARVSLLKRHTGTCLQGCSRCKKICRMGAIREDASYAAEECILCMDCTAGCPGESRFGFGAGKDEGKTEAAGEAKPGDGISRKNFLVALGGSLALAAGRPRPLGAAARTDSKRPVVRPPGALPEKEFLQRCIRCGNCMKVCLTNVLQPVLLQSGWSGIWTPHVDTNHSYCEHQCTLCGRVCPTGALRPLSVEEKIYEKIGTAVIDRKRCIPWARGEECLVCEEHCPVQGKAIRILPGKAGNGTPLGLPEIDPKTCVGCSLCRNKCPAVPNAITVNPE